MDPVILEPESQLMSVSQCDFEEDAKRYAREVILWGRKSGIALRDACWEVSKAKSTRSVALVI